MPTTGRDRAFLAVAAKHFVDAVAEGSDAVEPLIAALKDWDQRVRIDAVDALGQIGNVLAVDPLIALMNNSHGEDGLRATKALGQIGGERAIDALIARIEFLSGCFSNDGLDKTADSLTQCGTAAVDPLIQLLRHRIGYVRERAAISLGKIGDRRAVEPLIAALKDEEDGHVSYLAAEALGSIGDARAVPVLVALLQGQPYEVRHALKPVASLLTRNSDHFSRDQLIQLSQLQDISFTYELHATIEEVMGYGWEPTLTKHYFLDCSIVRNLAERILRTRSAKKESG